MTAKTLHGSLADTVYVETPKRNTAKNHAPYRDLYDWNGIDIISMVNKLKMMGNENAKVIVTQGKGIRLNGSKNPHSWSIMNPELCLKWVLKTLDNKNSF